MRSEPIKTECTKALNQPKKEALLTDKRLALTTAAKQSHPVFLSHNTRSKTTNQSNQKDRNKEQVISHRETLFNIFYRLTLAWSAHLAILRQESGTGPKAAAKSSLN